MDGGGKRNRVLVNCRSRPYYDRRCKKKMSLSSFTNIESLPGELVFLILLELEAREIYESALFVCRKWHRMIRTHDFTHTHLRHSTPGLLFRSVCEGITDSSTFLTLRGGRIETFKLRYEFAYFYWNTCNGLILGLVPESGLLDVFIGTYLFSGIGYSPASMKYKVVCPNNKHGCDIFTVGVDTTWRKVEMQNMSYTASGILYSFPLITEGLVYWTTPRGTSLWSLNLESELITEIHIPQGYDSGEIRKYYLSTWSSLTLLIESSSSGFSWDVWELKKPETGGEWKKLPKIDLEVKSAESNS